MMVWLGIGPSMKVPVRTVTESGKSGYGNNGTLTNGPTWTTTKPTLNFNNPYAMFLMLRTND